MKLRSSGSPYCRPGAAGVMVSSARRTSPMVTVAVAAPAAAGAQSAASGSIVTVNVSPSSASSSPASGIARVAAVAAAGTLTPAGAGPRSAAVAAPPNRVRTRKYRPPSGAASPRVMLSAALPPSGPDPSAIA